MAGSISQRRTGITLVAAAAVAWSTAPFFTRLLALGGALVMGAVIADIIGGDTQKQSV